MEGYGNILTVFKHTEEKLAKVESILNSYTVAYERVENAFFILIPALNAFDIFEKIGATLKAANLTFVFYFITLSDRSRLKVKGLPGTVSGSIKSILIYNN